MSHLENASSKNILLSKREREVNKIRP